MTCLAPTRTLRDQDLCMESARLFGVSLATTHRNLCKTERSTVSNNRQSKEMDVNANGLIRFTVEPCNFTLNIFQDFVFRYVKQER